MNNPTNNESIELTLPINAAYVSAARLTSSSIANRLGFDIDEIEDIKAAVSEACTFIVKQYHSNPKNLFKITFYMSDESLKIQIYLENPIKHSSSGDEMGLLMIKALMDELDMDLKENSYLDITMYKIHKHTSFA